MTTEKGLMKTIRFYYIRYPILKNFMKNQKITILNVTRFYSKSHNFPSSIIRWSERNKIIYKTFNDYVTGLILFWKIIK